LTRIAWQAEDAPSFDYGGFVVGDKPETASLLAKAPVRACVRAHVQDVMMDDDDGGFK
jgi:hypothetical protein